MHVTRDGGATWTDVTPAAMPELGTVDEIELSTHQAGRAYLAVQRYRMDDFGPYIFRTDDFGASWTLNTTGIPDDHPVRTVREDPIRSGLVFAGTEYGVFVSLDAGASWQSFQRNLPETPVTGMRVAHDDLIISTQGRSFWIMDDISPLREIDAAMAAGTYLFTPRDARRLTNAGVAGLSELNPDPPPAGAQIHFYLAEEPDEDIRVEVVDASGEVVRTFASDSATAAEAQGEQITGTAGLNRIAWTLSYPGPELPEGAVTWGYSGGVTAPPGEYSVRLTVGGTMLERDFTLLPDPRIPEVTVASYQEQFRVAMLARDSINSITTAIEDLAAIREQVEAVLERARAAGQDAELQPLADTLAEKSSRHEEVIADEERVSQDPIASRSLDTRARTLGRVTRPTSTSPCAEGRRTPERWSARSASRG